ncbi:hypothetical protein EUGRSUZ_G01606 [Eucalyptus grandis]|uniref:Uncharacterized protein n=2 Tax=Eucalyptus grandis TaxID=71139 RepID=A0ACC3K5L3_EUCGR|nr:hypothetical protein EUGRSUZ_G01606 [Eucalyptus grandis]
MFTYLSPFLLFLPNYPFPKKFPHKHQLASTLLHHLPSQPPLRLSSGLGLRLPVVATSDVVYIELRRPDSDQIRSLMATTKETCDCKTTSSVAGLARASSGHAPGWREPVATMDSLD